MFFFFASLCYLLFALPSFSLIFGYPLIFSLGLCLFLCDSVCIFSEYMHDFSRIIFHFKCVYSLHSYNWNTRAKYVYPLRFEYKEYVRLWTVLSMCVCESVFVYVTVSVWNVNVCRFTCGMYLSNHLET